MNKNEEIAKQLIKAASKDMTNAKEVAKALVEKGSDEEVEKVFEIFYNLLYHLTYREPRHNNIKWAASRIQDNLEKDEMNEILDEKFGYDADHWDD